MYTSVRKIKNLLEGELKKTKNIYIGDPIAIPGSSLPCLVVDPQRTDTEVIDNQRDSHVHYIDVMYVIDARQFFGATPTEMVGTKELLETMEGEDSSGNIKANSILGVLRDNLDLEDNRFIQNISSIDYTVRRRTNELITLESVVHLQVEYIVNR